MRATSLAGYKYDDGTHVCINCAHDDKNKESLKVHGERDIMFLSDFSDMKSPKCEVCKIKMIDVVWRDTSKKYDDGEEPDKKKPVVRVKTSEDIPPADALPKRRGRTAKPKPIEPVAKRGRGRPPKIKTEVSYTIEPVIKRGRGRPKGSKNKTGATL